ncbi:MAG: PAS domain S-box protein, partial [Pseudomonadota bacterium]
MSPQVMQELLHELQVHQIELEMQNEELRGAQLRLDAVRARYFDLYDLAPVAYCTVSEEGLILEANIAAAALLGVTRSKLVGQRISSFIVKSQQDSFYLHRKLAMQSGMHHNCELQMQRDDGSTFWIKLSTAAALDSGGQPLQRMVMNDITEAKELLMVIQQSEEKFRSLLESSPDATIIVGRQGQIVLANARTEAVFGYERAELLGKPVEMLMSPHLHQQHTQLRENFMQRPHTREMGDNLMLMGRRRDGHEFPIEVSLSPLQTAQGLLVSCAIRDV